MTDSAVFGGAVVAIADGSVSGFVVVAPSSAVLEQAVTSRAIAVSSAGRLMGGFRGITPFNPFSPATFGDCRCSDNPLFDDVRRESVDAGGLGRREAGLLPGNRQLGFHRVDPRNRR